MIGNKEMGANCQIEYVMERGTLMIRIIICDDDTLFIEKMQSELQQILSKSRIKAKINSYKDAGAIGMPILSSCDIAFLDIDFANKKQTGIDLARKLRQVRENAVIIFVTNYIEYAPEGYEVQAFRYLLKNEILEKLEDCLHLAIKRLHAVRETLKIQVNGEIIDIALEDILYIEAQMHTVIIHVQKDRFGRVIKQYSCYNSISSLEQQLSTLGFLRIHKSYLVNMRHIKKYQCHQVILSNDRDLRASEKNYREQKNKYLLWKGVL